MPYHTVGTARSFASAGSCQHWRRPTRSAGPAATLAGRGSPIWAPPFGVVYIRIYLLRVVYFTCIGISTSVSLTKWKIQNIFFKIPGICGILGYFEKKNPGFMGLVFGIFIFLYHCYLVTEQHISSLRFLTSSTRTTWQTGNGQETWPAAVSESRSTICFRFTKYTRETRRRTRLLCSRKICWCRPTFWGVYIKLSHKIIVTRL